MKRYKLSFQPSRLVFMADGPETGSEAKEKVATTNPFADAFEANAEKKPPVDIARKVPGYPEEVAEIKENDSDRYKKVIDKLLPELQKALQKQNRKPRHGDAWGGQVDGYSSFLVIDENASPRERVFVAKEKTMEGGQKTEASEIPPEVLQAKTKNYREIENNPPPDIIRQAKETFKKAQGREMEHEETATAFDSKDFEYVVLRDDYKKKFRVFKSPEPVPA
jgi:hypothetical protein